MIRVLQFAGTINRHDFIDNLVRYANPQQFEVGICVRSRQTNIAEPQYGQEIPQWLVAWKAKRDIPTAAIQLARILRVWQPHILHTHHYEEAVIGWLATRLVPQTRLVIGRHYSDSIYRSTTGLKRRLYLGIESQCNNAAARIVVPSTCIADILIKRQQVNPKKIERVPYGFVPTKYRVVEPSAVERVKQELGLYGHSVVGNFARLHEEKGQRFLIEAIAQLRDQNRNIRLIIVGEGPERAALEQQIKQAGLDEIVQLLGWRRDAMTLMAAVDIVVQPTLQEGFSQVMVEALWMSKPLVITDVSGASDIICDGENGLLVPKTNARALAGAIQRLLANEPLCTRLARAGRSYVERNLIIDKVIPQYERVYLNALGQA